MLLALALLLPMAFSKPLLPPPCAPAECGPRLMGMPNWECKDGRTGGPACLRGQDGKCGWTVIDCEARPVQPKPPAGAPKPAPKPAPKVTVSPEWPSWKFVPRPDAGPPFPGIRGVPVLSAEEALARRKECENPEVYSPEGVRERVRLDAPHPRFKPRTASLQRFLDCEYRDKVLVNVEEYFYLTLGSHELKVPGYSHPHLNPTLFEDRYFIECQGALRAELGAIPPNQLYSALDRTFTLPCGYAFFARAAPESYEKAGRMSGVYNYRVHGAWLQFTRPPTRKDRGYALKFSIRVENPVELLELTGSIEGVVRSSIRKLDADRDQRPRPKK